jgi:hypothetical protein
MGHSLVPSTGRTTLERLSPIVFGVAACLAFGAALGVFVFGVIDTNGVYGSRMAWLLGVVLPLLALTAFLSWLARRTTPGSTPGDYSRGFRTLTITALVLLATPFALVTMLLLTYLAFFVVHGVYLLVR